VINCNISIGWLTYLSKVYFVTFCFSILFPSYAVDAPIPQTDEEKVQHLRGIRQTWDDHRSRFREIQEELRQGTILYGVHLNIYDPSIRGPNQNAIVLVTLKDRLIKAIFKPRGPLHQRVEVGAFEVAQLGMGGLVPPTVIGQFGQVPGVLSFYFDVEDDQNPWKQKADDKALERALQITDPQSLNDFNAFVFVFGMWDLKPFNRILVGEKPPFNVMSLDNESLMIPVYLPTNGHFFVAWKFDPTCPLTPYSDLKDKFEPEVLNYDEVEEVLLSLERFFISDKWINAESIKERKREAILKGIRSFFWGKRTLRHFIGKKAWWIQLYADIPYVPVPKVTFLLPSTITRFRSLTLEGMKKFYGDDDSQNYLFLQEFYEEILSRRDSLLSNLQIQGSGN
jgi:hypothetical protein